MLTRAEHGTNFFRTICGFRNHMVCLVKFLHKYPSFELLDLTKERALQTCPAIFLRILLLNLFPNSLPPLLLRYLLAFSSTISPLFYC